MAIWTVVVMIGPPLGGILVYYALLGRRGKRKRLKKALSTVPLSAGTSAWITFVASDVSARNFLMVPPEDASRVLELSGIAGLAGTLGGPLALFVILFVIVVLLLLPF